MTVTATKSSFLGRIALAVALILIALGILWYGLSPESHARMWRDLFERPGGVMSVLLPCDPGLLWRLGRLLGPRARATEAGIDYDYWMAREHVNPINNLVVFIRYYFSELAEAWLPTRLPFPDVNLFYLCHVTKR